ncbi:MAG: hypothetical protein NZ602_12475 [Thermoguttaceae bacterium]|nr:hypothetical protein [Thermoguttaceae bacterium]MDW8037297.1 hypothetical protein [Thermoguttaceae bacterium]
MRFFVLLGLLGIGMAAGSGQTGPWGQLPTTYELMINGESFLLEVNQLVRLQSQLRPGTVYEVALRVSPIQYLRLNQIRLMYDLRCKVEDDRQPQRRTVRLVHPHGCHLLITELGEPLAGDDRETALRILTEATVQSYRQRGIPEEKMEVSRLETTQLPSAEARGVRIRYQDAKGIEHQGLIYLLVGKTFTCSFIVEYLQTDEDRVLPIAKRILDSIQPLPSTAKATDSGEKPPK